MAWWKFWKKPTQKVFTVADEFRRIYEDNQHKRIEREQERIKEINAIISDIMRAAKEDAANGYRKYRLADCKEYVYYCEDDIVASLKKRGFRLFKNLNGDWCMEW